MFFRKLSKKKFFLKDFLDFLLFYLILGLSPHIHLFFQLSSCTGWSTIRDFWIFQKTAFLPFWGPLPFSWGVFFDKISSPPLFLTANRVWERCLTAIFTLQSPPKNWQSSVTKYWTRASFMTDTVHQAQNTTTTSLCWTSDISSLRYSKKGLIQHRVKSDGVNKLTKAEQYLQYRILPEFNSRREL